ncbi:MAG: aldehyde dehydrogenase family protein [Bacteroidota bacterium]
MKSQLTMPTTNTNDINRIFKLQSATDNLMRLRSTTAAERLAKVRKVKQFLLKQENIKRLTDALHSDLRKPAVESEANEWSPVMLSIVHIEENLRKWMREKPVDTPLAMSGLSSRIKYESKGAVLILAPWNYPFQIVLVPLLHAITAGNAAIVKPSEFAPATADFLHEMLSGMFPENEVAFVFGEAEAATALLELPFHHIFFTGSPAIGKKVMAAASKHLTSVTLELGGKSPVIVHDSYDMVTAARKIAWAKTMNCGQTCIAPDYVMLPKASRNAFVAAYQSAINEFFNSDGKGVAASMYYPRIINVRQFARIKSLIDQAVGAGAEVLCGGETDENDKFIAPTVLGNVNQEMNIMREEIFGPVLPVMEYDSIDDAINQVNALERPLAMYVLSKNSKVTNRILQHTTSGGVGINELMVTSVNPALPFGGVNHSGMGRANGEAGFIAFSNERGIVVRHWGTFSLLYPPYKNWVISWMKRLVRW